METSIEFTSKSLNIVGNIEVPAGIDVGEKRPAFIVLHGFGSTRHAGNVKQACALLNDLGYVAMRFDMPGCGDSDGARGRLICLDQVEATSDALTALAKHSSVDSTRIGALGSSFGAAVAVYAGGVDQRIACVIAASGWGNGELKFQKQHPTREAYAKFTAMLAEGKSVRERTGKALMVPRYDIVPIPEHLRSHVLPGSIQMFEAETAQSMFEFKANEVISKIAPRPVLLLHSSDDHVTPVEQSIELFKNANQPVELHIFADTNHFMFSERNANVHDLVSNWLGKYFPLNV